MTGEYGRQFNFLFWTSFNGQLVHTIVKDEVNGVEGENRYFSPLSVLIWNMKIWYKI